MRLQAIHDEAVERCLIAERMLRKSGSPDHESGTLRARREEHRHVAGEHHLLAAETHGV